MTTADIDLQQLAEQAARIEGWVVADGTDLWWMLGKGHREGPPTLEERAWPRWHMLVKYADATMEFDEERWWVSTAATTSTRQDFCVHDHPDPAAAVSRAFVAVFGAKA